LCFMFSTHFITFVPYYFCQALLIHFPQQAISCFRALIQLATVCTLVLHMHIVCFYCSFCNFLTFSVFFFHRFLVCVSFQLLNPISKHFNFFVCASLYGVVSNFTRTFFTFYFFNPLVVDQIL
jgi:hypothetical protein